MKKISILDAQSTLKNSQSGGKRPLAGRNAYLFNLALRLQNEGLSDEEIFKRLHTENAAADPQKHPNFSEGPLGDKELQGLIESSKRYKRPVRRLLHPEEALSKMNKEYAIVMEAGKTIAFSCKHEQTMNRMIHIRHSLVDIKNFHREPVLIRSNAENEPTKTEPLGKFWAEHPEAKRYKSVVFSPGKTEEDCYNLWKGFAVEPRAGDWSLLRAHIYENVCSGNDEWYRYFMGWMARMVQQPDCPGEVAVALRGGKGVGKSITFRHIGRLFGQHFLQISNSKHLVGNFNAHLQDTIFLFADEAFYAGDKKQEPILKTIITEPVLFIEPKNVNAYSCPNYLHLAMASNNRWIVPSSGDERRYFVLDVSLARQQDSEYFGAIDRQMKSGGYEALLYDLMHHDISTFDVRKVPSTRALEEQKMQSLEPLDLWLLDRLNAGTWFLNLPQQVLYTYTIPQDHWRGPIPVHDIQQEYLLGMKDQGQGFRQWSTQLGMYFSKTFPNMKRKGNKYCFPSLQECRENFEEAKQTRFDWPETE